MRTLKTPEDIRKEVGNFPEFNIDKLIIAAQRDALECADVSSHKILHKLKRLLTYSKDHDIILYRFKDAGIVVNQELDNSSILNLLPKDK